MLLGCKITTNKPDIDFLNTRAMFTAAISQLVIYLAVKWLSTISPGHQPVSHLPISPLCVTCYSPVKQLPVSHVRNLFFTCQSSTYLVFFTLPSTIYNPFYHTYTFFLLLISHDKTCITEPSLFSQYTPTPIADRLTAPAEAR